MNAPEHSRLQPCRVGPVRALPVAANELGESPLWHPVTQQLFWCDIPGHRLHRFDPVDGQHVAWPFETDVACCAAVDDGTLLLALRSGLAHFDPLSGRRTPLRVPLPYDASNERFNDGKVDPRGRFWVGTIYEPRDQALAALYRLPTDGPEARLARAADGITTSNGLAWSPDGATQYWSDTKAHTVFAMDVDAGGGLGPRRVLAQFPVKESGQDLRTYGGRPDGAAVDVEGAYWCAMFEGARLVRLSPAGDILQEVPLPVRCPTMACFGGPQGRTLFVTTARQGRPTDELEREPLAGHVLQIDVDVAGQPVATLAAAALERALSASAQ